MTDRTIAHPVNLLDARKDTDSILAAHGITPKHNVPLSAHTTFRIGGPAARTVSPTSKEDLITVLRACRETRVPCAIVGNGSNLLCPDEGFAGYVVFTDNMKLITADGTRMTAEAGASLGALCAAARDRGLAGLTFAHGIPGTVGGALYMNAGAYDGEIGSLVTSVTYYSPTDDRTHTVSGKDCGFGYRTSCFQGANLVLLSAVFTLTEGNSAEIRAEMEHISARRREKQPLEYPSAGSAFKRYPGYFTAKLIDDAGLKGYTVGGAQISEKHAGFIINRGGASCADVKALMTHVQARIQALYGVEIEPEIRTLSDCVLKWTEK